MDRRNGHPVSQEIIGIFAMPTVVTFAFTEGNPYSADESSQKDFRFSEAFIVMALRLSPWNEVFHRT